MKIKDYIKERLKNPEFRNAYYAPDLKWDIAILVMDARTQAGLTQVQLARKMKSKQSAIARIESGSILPSLKTLEDIAKAVNAELVLPRFRFKSNKL